MQIPKAINKQADAIFLSKPDTPFIDKSIELELLPSITIITPSYQQGEFIEATIRSIIQQNYPKLQYIIIDGGSSDDTLSIIKHYEAFIDYWVSEKDNGQSDAINKGYQKSTGEIINWINSDDLLAKDALWKIAKTWVEQKGFDVLMASQYIFDENSCELKSADLGNQSFPSINFEKIHYLQQATFFRKSILGKQFWVYEDFNYIMDWEMVCRAISEDSRKVIKVDYPTGWFRYHDVSKSISAGDQFLYEHYRLYKTLAKQFNLDSYLPLFEHYEIYPELRWPQSCQGSVETSVPYFLVFRAFEELKFGSPKKAKALLQAIPFSPLTSNLKKVYLKLWIKLVLKGALP